MFESIGQRLKKEREARFLTLEKASEATRIRIVFLQALESNDYSVMPSAAQGRGFLRNYAEYLELNIDEMIAEIQKNPPMTTEVSGPLPQVNLVETEIPSLTESRDEKPARLSWMSRLGHRPKAESAPEAESTELVQEQIPEPVAEEVEVEQPKPRGRKKKKVVEEEIPQQAEVTEIKAEDATLPIDLEQAEVNAEREARPSLLSRLTNIFRSRKVKVEPEINEDSAPVIEAESHQPVPSQPADMIFAEIGIQLRERRELISLTFDEVERHTKLRAAFVKALEEGAFDKLPSPVQTRGMLANYATFLDLDVDIILLRFADGLQARRYEKYAETPREKIQTEVVTSIPLLRSFIAGDLIFGVVMIAILIALAIWGVGRVVNSQEEKNAQATAPSIVDVLGSTPLPTETSIAIGDNSLTLTVTADPLLVVDTPTPGLSANVTVSIFALERTFARISVDGEVAFEGRFAPGETKVFEAENQVAVLTGNAAGLRVTYNGRDLGLMGSVGEVVSRVYLITGVAIPTATISPTPTNTLPVTMTPTPTLTPTITPTVTPPDGG
jgi:cytoskeleton protein RodZ